jgi:hypothetical protein
VSAEPNVVAIAKLHRTASVGKAHVASVRGPRQPSRHSGLRIMRGEV